MKNGGKPSGLFLTLLLLGSSLLINCTNEPTLAIKEGNPPEFIVSATGILESITISGPDTQREAQRDGKAGDALPYWKTYWQIVPKEKYDSRRLEGLSPITYGQVPPGFTQTFPTNGEPPPLLEQGLFSFRMFIKDANGLNARFTIDKGKAVIEGS